MWNLVTRIGHRSWGCPRTECRERHLAQRWGSNRRLQRNDSYSSPNIIRVLTSRTTARQGMCSVAAQEKCVVFRWEKLKERDHLQDVHVDGTYFSEIRSWTCSDVHCFVSKSSSFRAALLRLLWTDNPDCYMWHRTVWLVPSRRKTQHPHSGWGTLSLSGSFPCILSLL